MQFKQKSVQSASVIWFSAPLYWALCILCIGPLPAATTTAAQTMAHKPGDQVATLRLIAAPARPDGTYDAAVEIAMPPGSHTYWKQPGEAGVPPVFAFNGSQNVSQAEVRFPVPTRLTEDGLDAFGYTGTVLFPVIVTPVDRSQPAVLKADVAYAVCNKICIPAHGTATLRLPSDDGAIDSSSIMSALALVPLPMSNAERAALKISGLAGGAKQSWQVTSGGTRPIDDLFVVVPEGFYFTTRKTGPDSFVLTADQVVAAQPVVKVPVTLVLKRPGGSLTTTETLDVRAASR